ncbi:Smr domain protein [Taphrina deformans PYCC 5710]|uniref:Smr domain protein n=1 Tax=Taphrina deformans (strain PYCC 5710 / ATCC 11124 / CBS 356.35 / IMI 108563 / JCM 9778 / NBRC 8474) TaxID=1097556 RepID=R4XAV0_TAPDE|nr:Smr domain protein [Taphrina deformans PYCC 5710]|eukprot:CCG82989.1 Smr domain protein [Taphrina deformans PYCC 5710]
MSAFGSVGVPRSVASFSDRARASNHADDAEYERLRGIAQHEASLRGQCFEASKRAYELGNGQLAHEKSEEGKRHGANMEKANQDAAIYVFRANNASCKEDELDLHGLHVEEAKYYTEQRIIACKQRRNNHLHIIVGKGIHSVDHVQKLKPAIEDLCQKHNFKYTTEHNEGRIYVEFPSDGQTGFLAPGSAGQYAGVQQPQQAYHPQNQPSYAMQNNPQTGGQQQYQQQQQGQQAGWEQYNTPANRKQALNILKRIYYSCCR